MKKLTLALAAILSLSTAAFAQEDPGPVVGSSGQVKFTGTVTKAGCTIVTGNNATIDLGSVPEETLKESYTAWSTGEIKFEGCLLNDQEITTVNLTIEPGPEMGSNNEVWGNNGTAADVGIEVEIKNTQVPPTGVITPIEAKIDQVNGTAIYPVRARMVGGTEVTAGSVDQTISFVASYQ